VRKSTGGKAELPFYGRISAVNVDPIEKKPLYHFRPGSSVFSVGFVGCNLRCPFCQNWEISQSVNAPTRRIEPSELIALAASSGSGAVAYTYSEPLVHIEYVIDSMRLAREAGLANILVTNGCVREEAARAALALCDAANVDLKSYRAGTYSKTLGGDLETVKRFIAVAAELGVHVEATTLVVTGMNDEEEEIGDCAAFLASVSRELPYHLSAYHPDFHYAEPATNAASLARFAETARKRLAYVYVGNLFGASNDTRCPSCGTTVVGRRGYRIDSSGLTRDSEGIPRCRNCSEPLPFRF
jgi:pyruvate formate lyase activating enzyme